MWNSIIVLSPYVVVLIEALPSGEEIHFQNKYLFREKKKKKTASSIMEMAQCNVLDGSVIPPGNESLVLHSAVGNWST